MERALYRFPFPPHQLDFGGGEPISLVYAFSHSSYDDVSRSRPYDFGVCSRRNRGLRKDVRNGNYLLTSMGHLEMATDIYEACA